MPFTVVSFHAHPDDEALFTAGTLARAVAEGHRVVLVTATDGGAGLAASHPGGGAGPGGGDLGARRLAELRVAAAAVGVEDVRHLGYEDSGMGDTSPSTESFCACDQAEAAERLRAVLDEVGADVLTIYDPAGGYGHPDHVQVHRVGQAAAALAGTPVVLQATVDRRALVRALEFMRWTGLARLFKVDPVEWGPQRFANAYARPELITHRVDVRRYADRKRRAMAAHATQATADDGVRTLAVFRRLPGPVFSLVFGHEWFVEQGRHPGRDPLDDIFASLRSADGDRSREAHDSEGLES
jgi:LmbE family N-acetylglucosaminyl deacetylase